MFFCGLLFYFTPARPSAERPNTTAIVAAIVIKPPINTVIQPTIGDCWPFEAVAFFTVNKEGEKIADGDGAFVYVGFGQPDRRTEELTGEVPVTLKL